MFILHIPEPEFCCSFERYKQHITSMAKPLIQNRGGGGGGVGGDGGPKAGTTFVQADSTCFRDLVQRLTGPSGNPAPPPAKSPAPKPAQKLHERRKYKQPNIEITKPFDFQFQPMMIPSTCPPTVCAASPGGGYGPGSWSTPLPVGCSKKRTSPSALMELIINPREEERAIKEKRFYLHPSPRSKPRLEPEPELLTLFPTTTTATTD